MTRGRTPEKETGDIYMNVLIRPSAVIRQNYNIIANLCKKTGEPVFLTKNGRGDLVVMDIKVFNERERQMEIREKLVEAEELRLMGVHDVPVATVRERLQALLGNARAKTGGKPYV